MRNKREYIWNLIGRFIPQFIQLGAMVVLARLLTPEDFGQISVLAIFIGISNTIVDSGLGGSLIKEKEITPLDCSSVFVFNFVASISIYLLLFVSAPFIAEYFNKPGLQQVSRALFLIFVIDSFALVPTALLSRELRFKQIMTLNIIATLFAVVVAIIIAYKGGGVYALVGYQITTSVGRAVLSIYFSKYKQSFKFSYIRFRALFSFGFFTTICNVIDTIYSSLLSVLFGRYVGLKQAGYLGQAQKIENSSSQALITTINTVSFPILTRLRSDKDEFVNECKETTRHIILLLFPVLVLIFVYSPIIITIILGREWIPASIYLKYLMIASFFLVLESLYRNYVKSYNRVRELMNVTLLKRIFCISILFASAVINTDYILNIFLICTAIGLMFNIYLYCSCLDISFFKEASRILLYTVGISVFTVLLYLLRKEFHEHILMDILIFVVCAAYYIGITYRLRLLNRVFSRIRAGHK